MKFVLYENYFFDFFFEVQICYYKTFEFGLDVLLERLSKLQPKYDFFKKLELLIST